MSHSPPDDAQLPEGAEPAPPIESGEAYDMNWLQKLMSPREKAAATTKGKVPEGLWEKCEGCGAVLYRPELERNLMVCPKCSHHHSMRARARLGTFLDEGSAEELSAALEPMDPLKFRDSKKYRDRIAAAQKATGEKDEWFFTGDLGAYLMEEVTDKDKLPAEPIVGSNEGDTNLVSYALLWAPNAEIAVGESYVNLIPTIEGGTHVNGLRSGLAQAVREFCEFRNLVPRGVKLTALGYLKGENSLIAAGADGSLAVWTLVDRKSTATADGLVMTRIHEIPHTGAPITALSSSQRTACSTQRGPENSASLRCASRLRSF